MLSFFYSQRKHWFCGLENERAVWWNGWVKVTQGETCSPWFPAITAQQLKQGSCSVSLTGLRAGSSHTPSKGQGTLWKSVCFTPSSNKLAITLSTLSSFLLSSPKDMLTDSRERGWEAERGRNINVKEKHASVASPTHPDGAGEYQTCNPGVCHGQNRPCDPSVYGTTLQRTEPHRPVLFAFS